MDYKENTDNIDTHKDPQKVLYQTKKNDKIAHNTIYHKHIGYETNAT